MSARWLRSGVVLAVPASLLALVYVETYIRPESVDSHPEAAWSTAFLLLIVACPLAAAAGALEAGRLRASRGMSDAAARPGAAVTAERLWPGVLAALVALATGICVASLKTGGGPWNVSPLIPAALVLGVCLHALGGWVLGLLARPVLAIGLAVVISYSWLGFAWTVEPTQIAYLAGPILESCCDSSARLDPRGAWAMILFSVCGIGALLVWAPLLLHREGRSRLLPSILAIALMSAGAAGGMGLAAGLGRDAGMTVPPEELRCRESSPQVCLTEVQVHRQDLRPFLSEVFGVLETLGAPSVSVAGPGLGMSPDAQKRGEARLVVQPSMTRPQAVRSAVSSHTGPLAASCQPESAEAADRLFRSHAVLEAWLIDSALGAVVPEESGLPHAEGEKDGPASAEVERPLRSLRAMTEAEQVGWVRSAFTHLEQCVPADIPGERR